MTQGNPFGRKGGRWMTSAKLRALFHAGLTYDEIAEINERAEGWKPSRSAVKLKFDSMDLRRRQTHTDLNPWRGKVKREHQSSRLRHMLDAEDRARAASKTGAELSVTDRKLVAQLHELLFGRGKLQVVGYHPEVGFYLTEREDWDEDIIRHPRAPGAYSGESPLRKSREAASSGDDGGSPSPISGERKRQRSASAQSRQSTAGRPRAKAANGTDSERAAG